MGGRAPRGPQGSTSGTGLCEGRRDQEGNRVTRLSDRRRPAGDEMEESAIGIAQFLTMLDLPVSLGGIVIGVIAAVRRPGFYRPNLLAATTMERIGVGLCVA